MGLGVCFCKNNATQFKENKKCCSPVVSYVEGVQALCEALHVVGADLLQKVDVILRVEATHVVLRRLVGFEHLDRGRSEDERQFQQ